MFNKSSRRDMERITLAMAELRSIQTNEARRIVAEARNQFDEAMRWFENEMLNLDRAIVHYEQMANTVANDGSNLGANLTTRERRDRTDKARADLDDFMAQREAERMAARKRQETLQAQATCRHEWSPVTEKAPDGHVHVTSGVCSKCGL